MTICMSNKNRNRNLMWSLLFIVYYGTDLVQLHRTVLLKNNSTNLKITVSTIINLQQDIVDSSWTKELQISILDILLCDCFNETIKKFRNSLKLSYIFLVIYDVTIKNSKKWDRWKIWHKMPRFPKVSGLRLFRLEYLISPQSAMHLCCSASLQ